MRGGGQAARERGLARPGGVHAELGAVRGAGTSPTSARSSGPGAPVLAVEAAASFGWSRWADASVSLDHFGASGPGEEVLAHFGFTADNVADQARALLRKTDDDQEESK